MTKTLSGNNILIKCEEDGRIKSLTYKGESIWRAVDASLEAVYKSLGAPPSDAWKALHLPNQTIKLLNEFLSDLFSLIPGEENACVRSYAATHFFEGATALLAIMVKNGQSRLARYIWDELLAKTREWESVHGQVHVNKSSIFYSLALLYLSMGDLDCAFMGFYAGSAEYRRLQEVCPRLKWRDSPPYRTVTLDPNPHNLLQDAVLTRRGIIIQYLQSYKSVGGKLTPEAFDNLFLLSEDAEIENVKRLFVHALWTFCNLAENVGSFATDNDFAKLRNLYIALSLCLVVDKTLAIVNGRRKSVEWMQLSEEKRRSFSASIRFNVTEVNSWLTLAQWKDLLTKLNPSASPPDVFVPKMLGMQERLSDGTKLIPQIHLMALALNLRNHGSHEIQPYNIMAGEFNEIFEALVHSLFVCVEQLA